MKLKTGTKVKRQLIALKIKIFDKQEYMLIQDDDEENRWKYKIKLKMFKCFFLIVEASKIIIVDKQLGVTQKHNGSIVFALPWRF